MQSRCILACWLQEQVALQKQHLQVAMIKIEESARSTQLVLQKQFAHLQALQHSSTKSRCDDDEQLVAVDSYAT